MIVFVTIYAVLRVSVIYVNILRDKYIRDYVSTGFDLAALRSGSGRVISELLHLSLSLITHKSQQNNASLHLCRGSSEGYSHSTAEESYAYRTYHNYISVSNECI